MEPKSRLDRLPDWPAMMRKSMAAQYVDMSPNQFQRYVDQGIFPQPVQLGNGLRWHRKRMDEAIGQLFGDIEEDWRVGTPFERPR